MATKVPSGEKNVVYDYIFKYIIIGPTGMYSTQWEHVEIHLIECLFVHLMKQRCWEILFTSSVYWQEMDARARIDDWRWVWSSDLFCGRKENQASNLGYGRPFYVFFDRIFNGCLMRVYVTGRSRVFPFDYSIILPWSTRSFVSIRHHKVRT